MADDATKIKKCGISVYRSDLFCDIYYLFPKEHDLIPIKSCCRDISNHLKSINVAGGSYRHFSSSKHMSEGQLILYRAGIFDENLYKDLLVCPSHRYKLGIYFKQTRTCIYPLHTGNGKVFRGVTVAESISVLQRLGTLLPVGTGICRNCCKKVSSLKNDNLDLGINKPVRNTCNSVLEVLRAIFLLLTFYLIQVIDGGVTDKWDLCGCKWEEWQAWGTCSKECNGVSSRGRKLRMYTNMDGCPFQFTTCATNDMGWEDSRCNAFCYNGGTSNSYYCSCVSGFYGTCCELQVNCGLPGTISFGQIHGSSYTYGSTITYSCNSGYILVGGSAVRTCQINHLWSRTNPRCAFYSSCSSHPCRNGAMCNNMPDDYKCICKNGWSGKHCEIDIQPPVIENCESNINVKTSDLTKTIEWKIPKFTDPHNNAVEISSNYPTNSWEFPWGDFNISYFAVKPNNGLSAECLFQIHVRPHPCHSLAKPLQGAVICNNWRTDYGQFCLQMCQESYTVPRGVDPFKWYVCGASGSWIPVSSLSNCTVDIKTLHTMADYSIADSYTACEEDTSRIQSYYINRLRASPFSYFCVKFPSECLDENVTVRC